MKFKKLIKIYGLDRALADQRRDGKEEDKEEGRLELLVKLVKGGVLRVTEAAQWGNMTVSEFESATGLKND